MSWSIKPLLVGWLRNRPKEASTPGHGKGEFIDLACFSWLLRDGTRTILVDLGPDSIEHTTNVHNVELDKGEEHDLVRLLAAEGVDAGELTDVVLTHLHWDHVRGLPLVPKATFLVQDTELRYAVYPPPEDHRVYEFSTGAPFLPYLNRMKLIDGRHEIAPGLTALFTPGHSPGHQSLLVEAASGTYLLAADYANLHENWESRIPTGPNPDVEAWNRTYEELSKLEFTLIPGHDPRVLDRAVYD